MKYFLTITCLLLLPLSVLAETWTTVIDFDGAKMKPVEQQSDEAIAEIYSEDLIFEAVQKGSNYFTEQTKQVAEEKEAVAMTLRFLEGMTGVAKTSYSEEGGTIWVEDVRGFSGIIVVRPMAKSAQEVEPVPATKALNVNTHFERDRVSAYSSSKRAIILEPFENVDGTAGDLKDGNPELIAEIMRNGGIDVTHVKGESAGIEQLSDIGEYDIIYMYTHCGYRDGNVTWMSGEKVTLEKTKKYREKYGEGVVIGRTAPPYGKFGEFFGYTGEEKYTINAEFVRKIKRLNKSVVYVSGCNSNRGKEKNSMAKALKDQGAEIYIGYDGFMLGGYATSNTDVDFFRYLIQHGLNIEEAMAKNPDSNYGKAYPLKIRSVGRFRAHGNNKLVSVDIDKNVRINLLKEEHKRLQQRLEELNQKIQADPGHHDYKLWETEMSRIRGKQKDIYQRVMALR